MTWLTAHQDKLADSEHTIYNLHPFVSEDEASELKQLSAFQEQWIWKNGLVVRMKTQISTLTRKVENFNVKICNVGGQDVVSTGGHLKDMLDLNTELIGYLSSLTDNVNVRDLFDFLTICYCEYDHFFKDHRREITSERQQRTVLLPLAYDIVFSEIKGILDFITNNTVNYSL